MRNKYRLSIMIVLIIMLFMYIMGIVGLADKSNFAFTLAALILSISMSVDTFAKYTVNHAYHDIPSSL